MKRWGLLIILVGFMMCSVQAIGQEVYRWTDEKGTVHLTDDLSQVPEKYLDQVQKKKISQEPSPTAPQSLPSPSGGPKAAPVATPREARPVSQPPERKDILGRGESWWRGQVKEWNTKLLESQNNYESAMSQLKAKQDELDQAKFKPDSLKRKLRTEIKGLEDKVNASRKKVDEAKDMLDNGLPKQAQEYRADPNWLR